MKFDMFLNSKQWDHLYDNPDLLKAYDEWKLPDRLKLIANNNYLDHRLNEILAVKKACVKASIKVCAIFLLIIFTGCGVNFDKRQIDEWQNRQMTETEALRSEIELEWPTYKDTLIVLEGLIADHPRIKWIDEGHDRFETYQEVVDNGYKSDCAGISAYWYELIRRAEIIPDAGIYFKWVKKGDGINHTVLIVDHPHRQIVIDNGNVKDYLDYKSVIAKYDIWSIRYIDSKHTFPLSF